MDPQNSKSVYYGIAAIVILLVVFAGVYFFVLAPRNPQQPAGQPTGIKANVSKKDVDTKILPDNFPSTIPLEASAKITQNYNASSVDGRVQATRAFDSKKTILENDAIYTSFFTNDKWKVTHTFDKPDLKVIVASKDNQFVQIKIQKTTSTQTPSNVEISYSILPNTTSGN